MIISHKYKFIYFAIPKTASHAIRFAMRSHLGENDEEHVHQFKSSKINIPEFKERKNGHFTVTEIKPYLDPKIWKDYFKFSFVRNPWDRFISLCFYRYPILQNRKEIAQQLMKEIIELSEEDEPKIFQAQSNFLYEEENSSPLDYVGRYENLQEDFDSICKHLSFPTSKLKLINPSSHQYYTHYFDEDFIQKVAKKYQSDINYFNYKFVPEN